MGVITLTGLLSSFWLVLAKRRRKEEEETLSEDDKYAIPVAKRRKDKDDKDCKKSTQLKKGQPSKRQISSTQKKTQTLKRTAKN